MKLICPNCGTHLTLDLLAGSDAARETLARVLDAVGPLGRALLQYLTLFRPKTRVLTADRMLTLLDRVLADIKAEQIRYDKKVYPAPPAAWLYAIDQAMQKRAKGPQNGGFKHLPLDSHNWLYSTISGWTPDDNVLVDGSVAPPPAVPAAAKPSQTVKAAHALQEFIEHG